MNDEKTLNLAQAAIMINEAVCEQTDAEKQQLAVVTILARNGDRGGIHLALSANVEGKAAEAILEQALKKIVDAHLEQTLLDLAANTEN